MGKEIEQTTFSAEQSAEFVRRLQQETATLENWRATGGLSESGYVGGFELEAWLLDHNFFPLPRNEEYLQRLNYPLVVPELSRFNVELNGTPQSLKGGALRRLEEELNETWRHCVAVAKEFEATLAMIGTLPTVRQSDLSLNSISQRNRYLALNRQILKMRGGKPLELSIDGEQALSLTHEDVMLEAASTSFQIHLQPPASEITRFMNASMIVSAPLVALSANSPFLFGKSLWAETRIPLFEQSVATGTAEHPQSARVTFGSGYLQDNPVDLFHENVENYPPLLPTLFDDSDELPHLRLQNGTIWRWNRLLVGFDEVRIPHLRIEHRPIPAGPTIVDMLANAAVFFGAVNFLARLKVAPEADLPFATAKDNFYRAARDGLDARLIWLDGNEVDVKTLLVDEILHMAGEGLLLLGIDDEDIERYIGIARARANSGLNGAAWQRAHASNCGHDLHRLTADYLSMQRSGAPVHEWAL
ncbi:MAG: glutamate-cysteine ligase family protein [Burkholderiales bacterium]